MARLWIFLAGLNGFLAVAGGAAGVHFVGRSANMEIDNFMMAAQYQMWHALALFGVAWMCVQFTGPAARLASAAGWAFQVGILTFSGPLYLIGATGSRSLAFLAPLGGLLLFAGWLLIAAAALRGRVAQA